MDTPRILVVDDDVLITRILARLLAEKGARVQTANDVDSALALAIDKHFDAVLSDVNIDTADSGALLAGGFRLATGLRGVLREDTPKFLFMTAWPTVDAATSAARCGARLVDKGDMQKVVEKVLSLVDDTAVKVLW